MADDPAVAPGAPGTAPAPAPAPSPAPAAPWWNGKVDDLTSGYMKNRGWDTLSPEDLAIQAMKSHQEAQKLIGVPERQLLRLPEDPNDEAGWRTVRQRLGAGQQESDYDLGGVKFANGEELDPDFVSVFQKTALAAGLPKSQAAEIARGLVRYLDGVEAGQAAENTAAIAAERSALQKNWGSNWDANMVAARAAANALGVTPEELNSLEGVVGYARTMEMFRNISTRIGEGRFVESPNPSHNQGIMSRDQAIARKAELMRDEAWTKRYLAGDATAGREMTALNTIIVGDDTDASRGRSGVTW